MTLEAIDGKPVDCHVVFGQVVGVHIDDRFIVDGRLDTAAMKPIARCGYDEYAVVESAFHDQANGGCELPSLLLQPHFGHRFVTFHHTT